MKKLQIPKSNLQRSNSSGGAARFLEPGAWRFSGAWRLVLGTSRLLLLLLLVLTALSPRQLCAQTNTATPVTSSNRFLIIVDTSRAMQRRSEGTLKAVQDLLASGMGGQLRPGDTLGVWTFNQELLAGRFALQRWLPETHRAVANRILDFIRGQTYEKQASLEKVLPEMERVIKGSDFMTVILISDGDQKIKGTPFDDRINGFYKLWRSEQQKAGMPFITVLRARNGSITDHSVNSAPWPVEIPPLPPEVAMRASAEKKRAEAQRPPAAPLVFSGKKSEPVPPPQPSRPSAISVPKDASQTESALPQAAKVETVEVKKNQAASVSLDALPSKPPAASPLVPVADTRPNVEIPKPPAAKSEESALAETRTDVSAPAPVAPSKPSLVPPSSTIQPPSSTSAATAQTAAVTPGNTFFSRTKIIIAAFVLALIAFGFIVLLMRGRSRPAGRVSLITRSLDREQK